MCVGASKRIPVSPERKEELYDLKGPNQTYDELLEELVIERKKKELAESLKLAKQDRSGWTKLEDV